MREHLEAQRALRQGSKVVSLRRALHHPDDVRAAGGNVLVLRADLGLAQVAQLALGLLLHVLKAVACSKANNFFRPLPEHGAQGLQRARHQGDGPQPGGGRDRAPAWRGAIERA